MRSNYKRVGDYIRKVKTKNTDGKYSQLLGISIDKYFLPSVANIIGTDLTKYKVVQHNQFACNRMHVGRDYKIPIALSQKLNPFIVSPAYTVFEVLDETKLCPEYLMMWCSRSEFDREAWFHTDADVRGGLPWDLFCDIELPIPPIEKQKAVIQEYNFIIDRININQSLKSKLEKTLSALYKHWFIDFEFPNEKGQPYRSSGGEMVFNEKLKKDIPSDWETPKLENFVKLSFTGDWGSETLKGSYLEKVQCIRGADIEMFKSGDTSNSPTRFIQNANLKNKKVFKNNIIIEISGGGPSQSTGRAVLVSAAHIQLVKDSIICSNFCRVIKLKSELHSQFFYSHIDYLYNIGYLFTFENSTTGVKNFDLTSFLEEEYLVNPPDSLLNNFNNTFNLLQKNILICRREINNLKKLKDVALTKLSKMHIFNLEKII